MTKIDKIKERLEWLHKDWDAIEAGTNMAEEAHYVDMWSSKYGPEDIGLLLDTLEEIKHELAEFEKDAIMVSGTGSWGSGAAEGLLTAKSRIEFILKTNLGE